jgi:hypothetical protein
MARAEVLVSACQAAWELRAGQLTDRPASLPADLSSVVAPELMDRILGKLDAFAERWKVLQPGEDGITLTWPRGRSA